MENNIKTFKEFLSLKKSQKFNAIITLFSTIISGFLIVLVLKPNYIKELSTFHVVLFSLVVIAPIYLLNQFLSILLAFKTSKSAIKKIVSFAKSPEIPDTPFDKFTEDVADALVSKWVSKTIYTSPTKQLAEITTITSCYISAFFAWHFGFGFLSLYIFLVILSVIIMCVVYKIIISLISQIKSKHLKLLVAELKKDEHFTDHLEKRFNKLEANINDFKMEIKDKIK